MSKQQIFLLRSLLLGWQEHLLVFLEVVLTLNLKAIRWFKLVLLTFYRLSSIKKTSEHLCDIKKQILRFLSASLRHFFHIQFFEFLLIYFGGREKSSGHLLQGLCAVVFLPKRLVYQG